MIDKQLSFIVDKYKITKTDNILYGSNNPKVKMVLPTPFGTHVKFNEIVYYFFYFDEEGIIFYPINGNDSFSIKWNNIDSFKMKRGLLTNKMIIIIDGKSFKFNINRFVLKSFWIRNNIIYLESNNYFYHK